MSKLEITEDQEFAALDDWFGRLATKMPGGKHRRIVGPAERDVVFKWVIAVCRVSLAAMERAKAGVAMLVAACCSASAFGLASPPKSIAAADDSPIALPIMPGKRTFEAFTSCRATAAPLTVRASGRIYGLRGGRWRPVAGRACTWPVETIYVTPSWTTLRDVDGNYRVALAKPTLSDDPSTRLMVARTDGVKKISISQRVGYPQDGSGCARECASGARPANHAVAVDGYVLGGKAYLVVRSFRNGSTALRLTLIPASFLVKQRVTGAFCVQNVAIVWDVDPNQTKAAELPVCR